MRTPTLVVVLALGGALNAGILADPVSVSTSGASIAPFGAASLGLRRQVSSETNSTWPRSYGAPEHDPPPSDCAARSEFSPLGGSLDVADEVIFRARLPDLLEETRAGVTLLGRHGGFENNTYCMYFGSCDDEGVPRTQTSETYLPCPSNRRMHASKWLLGAATRSLPGALGSQGDNNVFCRLSKIVARYAEREIIPHLSGVTDAKCVVQELFSNLQTSGAYTNPHVHADDVLGAIFYVDAPPGTRLCYDDGRGTPERARWDEYDPGMVRDVGRGHVAASRGDLIVAPLGWLRHWVPPVRVDGAVPVRTAVVLNMACL